MGFYCLNSMYRGVFIDPGFGIGCLGKVNMVYENDRELMIRFYGFVAKEEMACDEAELGPDEFAEKICNQHKLQAQQLEMLKYIREFHIDDQSAVLEKSSNDPQKCYSLQTTANALDFGLHEQMQNANFDSRASIMPMDRIEEFVRTRSTPMARPSHHG
ncbi:hypothetical protein Cgig2_003080 [Carnegiea gigantea]|uniref:Uncharacterized protein n=1 Tax=Carnegiea gigantea TaxID=171969 RepID=A0A9Q1KDM9_9CARY|nr:hypothetical protein Cgig2_003080 [Carnegiea gigantea]